MMTLKYPVPVARPHDLRCRELSLFSLLPQRAATLSERDVSALSMFCVCAAICERLPDLSG